ncbi:MAG: hypothetical protein HQ517_15325 [SAR324 cluster bacterium]|nr:hypothetical protein [SAR324 cluster bacterium]
MEMNLFSLIGKTIFRRSRSQSGHHLFLTVSANRSGSTYLELMLNCLPDARTDFEFQWTDNPPTRLHVAMKSPDFDLKSKLVEIADGLPIGGSKMVVPGVASLGSKDFREIREALIPEISIIHIGRKYVDSYLSKLRNIGHLRNPEGVLLDNESREWLQETLPNKSACGKVHVDEDELWRDLRCRYRHDSLFFSLNDGSRPYFYVEYSEIGEKFGEIVRFLHSRTTSKRINEILKRPPTMKLPKIDYSTIVDNFSRVYEIGMHFETMRQRLIRYNQSRLI